MNSALPILYILDASVAVTGAFAAARNTERALQGAARVVLVLPNTHAIPADALQDFYRVERIAVPPLSKNISAVLHYVPQLCMGAWRLRRLMARDGATGLMVNDFYLMHGLLLRLLGFGGTVVTWVRCDPTRFAGALAKPMLWLMARSSSRVVAVSVFVQQLLAPAIRSDVVYDYFAGAARTPKQWGAADEKRFVMIGNYIRGKGQDVALAAFMKAAEKDSTLRLHFYGGDMGLQKNRDYRAELEATAKQSAYANRITFHDATRDGATVLADAYAALNFSESESFSMTVLEASGAGVPVIATRSGGPQEILVEGATGYFIAKGDVAAAADAMLKLAANPAEAERMGAAGAQHIHAHFSPVAFASRLRELFGLADS